VALYVLGFSVIAAIAAATTRETYRMRLRELDDRRAERFAPPPVVTESTPMREPVLVGQDSAPRHTTSTSRSRS
jgi:hypothetical protein